MYLTYIFYIYRERNLNAFDDIFQLRVKTEMYSFWIWQVGKKFLDYFLRIYPS